MHEIRDPARYRAAVLTHLVRDVESAPAGERNRTLNAAAFKAARIGCDPQHAGELLAAAARAIGLPAPEVKATLRSAFKAGAGAAHLSLVEGGASGLEGAERVPADGAKRIDAARKIWSLSRAPGEMHDRYFMSRGLRGFWSPWVRELPAVGGYPPAIVAAATDHAGQVMAVQTTRLDAQTGRKAEGPDARRSRGVLKGHAIRLFQLDNPCGLIVGEGVETVAALARFYLDQGARFDAWAATGKSLLRSIQLPEFTPHLVVAADSDGIEEATALARRVRDEGLTASVVAPEEGFGDFNDILMARTGGHGR
ncbi:MAG: toprim domain-containing protein [Neomegalonema sp.]|nr:toprim domain-containing protein [Neomegalonema sp.]